MSPGFFHWLIDWFLVLRQFIPKGYIDYRRDKNFMCRETKQRPNPPTSAVRCALSLGYVSPLTENWKETEWHSMLCGDQAPPRKKVAVEPECVMVKWTIQSADRPPLRTPLRNRNRWSETIDSERWRAHPNFRLDCDRCRTFEERTLPLQIAPEHNRHKHGEIKNNYAQWKGLVKFRLLAVKPRIYMINSLYFYLFIYLFIHHTV